MKFAIVDVETTGGAGEFNRITEVGIVLIDGMDTIQTYHSLINPGTPITPFVVKLTGITDEMVENAPQFHEVAEKINELLKNRIFVAHNVQFDYKMIRTELKRCCIEFDSPRLCTVKLSRKIFQGLSSYSLYNLTQSLNLPDFNHHRALDDTFACAEILKLCLNKVGESLVTKEIKNLKKYLNQ